MGYRAILVNNNPETVSTDFDTSNGLYFEPVTLEDVMDVISHEEPMGGPSGSQRFGHWAATADPLGHGRSTRATAQAAMPSEPGNPSPSVVVPRTVTAVAAP